MRINIGESLQIQSGYPFNSNLFSDEDGTPLIRIRDLSTHNPETYYVGKVIPEYLINKGDILVGMDGEFNIERWKGVSSLLNQRLLRLSEKKGSDLCIDFAYYLLKGILKEIEFTTSATTVKHLSVKDLYRRFGNVPPLPQQRKIAKILSKVDAQIEATEQLIAKYEMVKEGLMQDLFTRGIDVSTGKLRTKYQDAPHLYKESVLGWVPKEWEVKSLDTLGSFRKGGNIPKSKLTSSGVGCILYGQLYTTFDYNTEEVKSFVPEYEVKGCEPLRTGDILFAGSGETHEEIGKCVAYLGTEEVYAGGDIVIFSMKHGSSLFMSYYLNFTPIQKQKSKLGQGSSVIHIYSKHLGLLQIAVPTVEEQNIIAERIKAIEVEISQLEKNNIKNIVLKSGLMQDLLTGKKKVKVEEAEEELAKAAEPAMSYGAVN